MGRKYHNESWLHEEYVENGRSMSDIAKECGVSSAVILKWLRRFDINTRSTNHHQKVSPASYTTTEHGYELSRSKIDGDIDRVYIHQLIVIANDADPHKVFSNGDWHAHHKNGVRWDNRPENIEFIQGSDHIRHHSKERVRTETGEWG